VSMIDPLPSRYRILAESIDFKIPGFESEHKPGHMVLAPRRRDCGEWFHSFVDRLVEACGSAFLPVMRLGDGELRFVLGEQSPDVRLPVAKRARQTAGRVVRWVLRREFVAATPGHYVSGIYSRREWRSLRDRYGWLVRTIGQKGVLALPLHYGEEVFYERYYRALRTYLDESGIALTDENYVPVYFPYAALTGPRRGELLRGRRVLVINGAAGAKRAQAEAGLAREGVADITWLGISPARSLFDTLDVQALAGRIDLALVGAGIGKANLLEQLEPLKAPCVDAGFVFEVWADPANARKRPFCNPDGENTALRALNTAES
jgi:hypothetical protein